MNILQKLLGKSEEESEGNYRVIHIYPHHADRVMSDRLEFNNANELACALQAKYTLHGGDLKNGSFAVMPKL